MLRRHKASARCLVWLVSVGAVLGGWCLGVCRTGQGQATALPAMTCHRPAAQEAAWSARSSQSCERAEPEAGTPVRGVVPPQALAGMNAMPLPVGEPEQKGHFTARQTGPGPPAPPRFAVLLC